MDAPSAQLPGGADRAAPGSTRDEFIDLCRAFSLLVVVLWHWVFTIVVWHSTGPSADSPCWCPRSPCWRCGRRRPRSPRASSTWFGRAALLIVSPLWFIAVSLALVLLTPLAIRLHQRFGPLFPLHTTGYAIAFALLWLAGNRGHGPARDGPVPTGGTALSVGPTGL